MSVSLKIAELTDIEELMPLIRELYLIEGVTSPEDRTRSALIKLLGDSSLGVVLEIWSEGALAGHVILTYGYDIEYGGRDAWITDFYVRPDFQGRGVGTQALKLLEEMAKARGVCALHLMVYHTNLRAKGVYLRSGFEPNPRVAMVKIL
ncbi:MAG TPA: GNAT family N-acetyltransferase [Terriglobales bacterium]|nr:GNAT family N-acetyltransferase [Terriglobales bacterium]